MNFRRLIRRNNEEILWRAWRRTEGILFLPHAGTVAGFSGLPRRAIAELRPYGAVTGQARALQYPPDGNDSLRSEEHTSELQSRFDLVCRLLLEKKKCILDPTC